MNQVTCSRCAKKRRVPVWPLRCSCGLQTNEDGSTVSLRSRGLGDEVANVLSRMGFKKKQGCGCQERQERLNGLSKAITEKLEAVATWLHPR